MSEQLSELDELIESDVLEALGEKIPEKEENNSSEDIDGITIEDLEEEDSTPDENPVEESIVEETPGEVVENEEIVEEATSEETNSQEIVEEATSEETNSQEIQEVPQEKEIQLNTTDLASLLSELLNNKTIEITIKVKD